jgi:hypothetical protein
LFTYNTTTGVITVDAAAGGTLIAQALLAQATADPSVRWNASGNAADQKKFRATLDAVGALRIAAYTDADVEGSWFQLNRDGTLSFSNSAALQTTVDFHVTSPNTSFNASLVDIPWNGPIYGNSGSWFVGANGRFTPPAGRYHITAGMTVSHSGAATGASLQLVKMPANTIIASSAVTTAAANYSGPLTVAANIDANGTDYFVCRGNGTATTLPSAGWFNAFKL